MNMNKEYKPFDILKRDHAVYIVLGDGLNDPVLKLIGSIGTEPYIDDPDNFVNDSWENLGNIRALLLKIGEHFNGTARDT